MQHSATIGGLAKALVAAQADIKALDKNAQNPHFKSKYTPLDAIVAMIRPALARHGLAVLQSAPQSEDGKGLTVETRLIHESGEWMANAVYIPIVKADPQGAGAAMTYGRRFGLSSLIGITSEEDDDGNNASRPPARQSARSEAREPRAERAASPETPKAGAEFKVGGRPMSELTDAELRAYIDARTGEVKFLARVMAARVILEERATKRTPDEVVAKAKAEVEAETASLPFR